MLFLPRLGSEGHEGILWNNSYMNDFINCLIEKLRNNSILQIEALWGQWTLRVPSKIYVSLRWSKGDTDFGPIFVVWRYKKSTLQKPSHKARVLSLHLTWTRGPCIAVVQWLISSHIGALKWISQWATRSLLFPKFWHLFDGARSEIPDCYLFASFYCIIISLILLLAKYTYPVDLPILFIWTTAQLKSLPTYLFNRYRNPF